MQDDSALNHFLQGGLEGLDELMGKLIDEADRVGDDGAGIVSQVEPPGSGIESREELVFHQYGSTGEPVEQGGFARVGVTDQRERKELLPGPAFPLDLSDLLQLVQVLLQGFDALADAPAVHLQLGLARTAVGADAAAHAGQLGSLAGEAGQQVVQLGQLNLGLALAGVGMKCEYIQYQSGAIDDLAGTMFFQVSLLGRSQFPVEDNQIGLHLLDQDGEFFHFPFADEEG